MSLQPPSRDDVLERYRACREAINRHLNAAVRHASRSAIEDAARRIGLLFDGTLVAESDVELNLVFDLVLFTAKTARSRAIDRYARANSFLPGSVEATVLSAMQANTFHIVEVKGRHPAAGILVDDVIREKELWVMDEGFEASLVPGFILATRLVFIEPFHCTVGSLVPVTEDVLEEAILSFVARRGLISPTFIDDPRLPEALYAAAIHSGAMDFVVFRDPSDPALAPAAALEEARDAQSVA